MFGRKSINIKDTMSAMPMDTEKFGKFNTDLFKKDYQEMIRKIFPLYKIEFNLINDENWLAYPDIIGDITEDEKNEIIKTMESDPLFDLFTNDKYYTDTPREKSKNKSIENRIEHMNKAECIFKGIADLSNFKTRKLSSVELNFLVYISEMENPHDGYIPEYWTYDYHLNYKDVLEQFLGQNLLEIVELRLHEKINYSLKSNDLKEILRNKSLPLSGSKPVLIDRVIENLSEVELETFNKERYIVYKLTGKGNKATEYIKPSITKDIDLEDKCYKLILDGSINEAYKLIAEFEAERTYPREKLFDWNNTIDWNKLAKVGLNDTELSKYRKILNIDLNLPENIRSKQKNINACIVLGVMFDCPINIMAKLVERVCNLGIEKEKVIEYIQYELGI
jgi:hypothetical protein